MSKAQTALEAVELTKNYGAHRAVDELSFEVRSGEIFGLLGPNGAGKTTTIRMALDIIKPTSGDVYVLGGPMTEEKKNHIGYLPEERGLYEDMKLIDTLSFFGQLKGLSPVEAIGRAEPALKRLDLWQAREKKIKALSRGMRQKAQFIAAIMHQPQLLIVDEPFSGLDPVNTRRIKYLIEDLRDQGVAIIMSTHQMHQVEALCERILLVNQGRRVLYGRLADIRKEFASDVVEVELKGELGAVPGVERIEREDSTYRLMLGQGVEPHQVLQQISNQEAVAISRFERVHASLEEIFIQLVGMDTYPTEGEAELA